MLLGVVKELGLVFPRTGAGKQGIPLEETIITGDK
jgi:hypothetical protein